MDIALVVSNHPDLRDRVERDGLRYEHLPITPETKPAQEARLLALIDETRSDLVVLARYMQVLSDSLCEALRGRAINIHHSFLPGFKGAKPYHQAHRRGVKLIGATAHYVTADLDEGPIIEQVVERVSHAHTPDALAAVGRDSERTALSRAVRCHVEHRVVLDGDRTVVFS
jgi:formyltetrahydrofolate deformylase